jgi:choline dehydrogenase-like flavoprotein
MEGREKGFILSPHVPTDRTSALIEYGAKGLTLPRRRLSGLMTKTADEPEGCIYPDGTFSKPVTQRDWARLNEGSRISAEILIKAGADPKSILVSKPQGAHPGGTAAIGQVVDRDLQTEVDHLFVCDASVLPKAPGLPPILTLVALAKRLAKTLAA